ncbi:TMEM165/GDT1 family protein [Clostridium sp. D2Q-11]|uniref:GDT1 family protein n=1 Tax=Anaeromonas frigoriresistens TaxID=2683708 RepID=A0A942Z886_9FIRM|nr:TMEM165/GDT1 family protein [Anaeromonas frigoriresistens]MBS4537680.1 TMEM165/GDT1 family protein [Anaeromonas frigoriresistens]
MISEYIKAFLFIFMAEMGDKTQILAMTFATQYSVSKVLLGVFIGSLLNHGIAIALGAYLGNMIPLNNVQIIAGLLFILFGIWGLWDIDDEEDEGIKKGLGPILTVSLAFFIGELGDKTQLTAMTLATEASFPSLILLGTVTGMIITSGFGIFIGRKLGEKIPELWIKLSSSLVFIFFGTLKLFQTLPQTYLTPINIGIFFIGLLSLIFVLSRRLVASSRLATSSYKEVAITLYNQTHKVKEAIDDICLGENHCGMCTGTGCLIGFIRRALKQALENEKYILDNEWHTLPKQGDKNFDQNKVIAAMGMMLAYYREHGIDKNQNHVINKARKAMEKILFKNEISFNGELENYLINVQKEDRKIYKKIIIAEENIKNID